MRILFVGGIQQKDKANKYYNTVQKLINGFTREGHNVIHFSDRDVARQSNIFNIRKLGKKKCNVTFIEQITSYRPHLIVLKHADNITAESLIRIKSKFPEIKIVQINIDALFNPDNVKRIKSKSGLVDANFLTTYGDAVKKVKQNNKPIYYIPNPVDKSIESHKAFEVDPSIDLLFVCGNAPNGDRRFHIPHKIINNLPNLNFKYCVTSRGTALWGNEYNKVLKDSKMGLNLSRTKERIFIAEPEDLYMYSSDRLAQYIGNGLLTFTNEEFSIGKLFTKDEMVFYKDDEDLIKKIKYFKENVEERKRIAKNGWKRAHKDYNERLCARFIIEVTFNKIKTKFSWPTKAF
ncbi:MAG: hypothetical protein ACI9TY_000617 [Alphaproteobacteria bacterium]|jgi:hypothetical protein